MKIELKKISQFGSTSFYIYVDGSCEKAFSLEADAQKEFDTMIKNTEKKVEIIKTFEL